MNFKELFDSYFWFQQPSINLSFWDNFIGVKSLALIVVGLLLWGSRRFTQNPINKKLISKLSNFAFTVGLFGIFWYGLRYENTPIFSKRLWAGLVALGALVWLVFVLKYWLTTYRREKAEHEALIMREKYLPKKR